MEEELEKYKLENHRLKISLEKSVLDQENNEETIRSQNEAELQKLTQEKDDIIFVYFIKIPILCLIFY